MKHGSRNERFDIEGEEPINGPLIPGTESRSDEPAPKSPSFKYCRLFSKGDQPLVEDLEKLANTMATEGDNTNDDQKNSLIPAGYTYLAQFIDHDITLDRTDFTKDGKIDPELIENFRTPSLDLDSLYLGGPENNSELYNNSNNSDKRTFKIGTTTTPTTYNDLPRLIGEGGHKDKFIALIGDPHNDGNLIVAQTTLAFLKFHNALAAKYPEKSFEELREEVTLYYQAIVLTDFLPRVLDTDVLNDVLTNGRRFYTDDKKDCMPVEFSVAAFRMGHSMVRSSYNFNFLHPNASLKELFDFSGVNGGSAPFGGLGKLPYDWIIDWHRFYDFSEVDKTKDNRILNYARKLDTQMANGLGDLPQLKKVLSSLATRDLLRGRFVSLPSGQKVAEAVREKPLTQDEILQGIAKDQAEILKKYHFDTATPLWYYILREAMVQAKGDKLGKVGSRIVAETFVGLIQNSRINVMKSKWSDLSDRSDLSFSMPKLWLTIQGDHRYLK